MTPAIFDWPTREPVALWQVSAYDSSGVLLKRSTALHRDVAETVYRNWQDRWVIGAAVVALEPCGF